MEEVNIVTDNEPKNIKVSNMLPEEIKQRYIKNFKDHIDVFAWKYEYLNTYDTSIIEHNIPLNPRTKPFKQKHRKTNPIFLPIIEKERRKLLDAKIIISLRYSEWVANHFPGRKKSGEIRMCVDFRNLNKCSLKENYTLPKMDQILQKVC